jgi:sterol 3beta-glucosyltransferase
MAPEGDLKKRVARKLTKRRKEGHQVTMDIPERFQDGDDAEEDCTAPPDSKAYMNQSVFGMITAAGSQVDFNARFDGQSSDEEDESGESSVRSSDKDLPVRKMRQESLVVKPEKHRRKISDNKLLRSFSGLGSKSKTKPSPKSGSPARESTPEMQSPDIQVARTTSHRDAPVMSRMLEAEAELSMRPSFDLRRPSEDQTKTDGSVKSPSSSLANRLKEIFDFEKAEDVIEGKLQWQSGETSADTYRIPLLAVEERSTARLYVYYDQTYLFLCVPAQEICKSPRPHSKLRINSFRMKW